MDYPTVSKILVVKSSESHLFYLHTTKKHEKTMFEINLFRGIFAFHSLHVTQVVRIFSIHTSFSCTKEVSNDDPSNAALAVMSGIIFIFRLAAVFLILFRMELFIMQSLSSLSSYTLKKESKDYTLTYAEPIREELAARYNFGGIALAEHGGLHLPCQQEYICIGLTSCSIVRRSV